MAKTTVKPRTPKKLARGAARPGKSAAAVPHGHSEFELSNEHIEASLRTGENAGLLEDYFGPDRRRRDPCIS